MVILQTIESVKPAMIIALLAPELPHTALPVDLPYTSGDPYVWKNVLPHPGAITEREPAIANSNQ